MPRYSYERYNPGKKPAMYSVKRNIDGELICLCSYKRGAIRVCNELNALAEAYKRRLDDEVQQITKLNGVLSGK